MIAGKILRLLELFLVIVLAEGAKQRRRATEQIWIEARRLRPQLRGRVAIDEDGATKDAMLAHQIFDRADFLFVVVILFRFGGLNFLIVCSRQNEPRASGDDTRPRRALSNSIICVSFYHESFQAAGSSSNNSPNNSRSLSLAAASAVAPAGVAR